MNKFCLHSTSWILPAQYIMNNIMWVDYCSYIYIVILNNYLFIGVVQCMPRIESISTSSGVGGKEGLPISDTIILESLHCYLYLAVDNHATKILTTFLCTAAAAASRGSRSHMLCSVWYEFQTTYQTVIQFLCIPNIIIVLLQ